MKYTAEERVYESLLVMEMDHSTRVTANQLADFLGMKRNSASHYLNLLLDAEKVRRSNTKPARWHTIEASTAESSDVFADFVGYQTSLENEIEQCKAAIEYPPRGLPIIINGKSGVGKSYLASLIHTYSLKEELLQPAAPFVVLNCADYANNPELLSATLFGYKKGTFTGADSDRTGLIDEADKGILFLDEVHRLSYENQEKLFLLMDQGIYRPLGEKGVVKRADIRFIFATTENNDEVLLDTFQRRIPVSIRLPDFHERPFEERIQLIHRFYKNEALTLQKNIILESSVLEYLSFSKFEGNIGRLKNLIKISCANSWRESKANEKLDIELRHFPDRPIEKENNKTIFDAIEINCTVVQRLETDVIPYSRELIESLWDDIIFFDSSGFNKNILQLLKNKTNKIIKQIENELQHTLVDNELNETLRIGFIDQIETLLKNYGIFYTVQELESLFQIYKYFQYIKPFETSGILTAYQIIRNNFSRENYIARKLMHCLSQYKIVSPMFVEIFFTFFIENRWQSKARLQGLIVTHGSSTASSIASVANYLCRDFIFESVDMPIDVSSEEIISNVRGFIEQIDTKEGLVLLVDMGSLRELFKKIKTSLEGELLIINNVTTMIALDIGTKLSSGASFDQLIKECSDGYISEAQYYEGISKGDNIIVSCISGLGISEKLRDIISEYVDSEKIEIITIDHEQLAREDQQEELLQDTRLIITTSRVAINADIPILEMEKIWSPIGEEVLKKGLRDSISKEKFEELKQSLVRFFSIEGISDRLTFLNPAIVIADAELVVSAYEDYYNVNFELFKRMNLCMHISIMLERLILENSSENDSVYDYSQAEIEFNQVNHNIFDAIAKKYNVELSDYEVHVLYTLVTS